MKTCTLFVALLLFLSTLAVLATEVEDVIRLPKTGHRKPVIYFDHRAHVDDYNAVCIDCHHKGTNQKCSSCHDKKDRGNVINLKGAFHQQCHDCHLRTSGPRACGRCHIPPDEKKGELQKEGDQ